MLIVIRLCLGNLGRRLWAWRSRLIWVLVALFAAIDSLPSEPLHPPLTILAILLAAVWTHSSQQQGFRRTSRRMQARIRELRNRADAFELAATTDPVTGLANRQVFYAALAEALGKPLEGLHGAPALLLIDLDRFKTINDTYGHAAGDAVLVRVARILQQETRAEDLAARLGGDEFGLLVHRTTPAELLRTMQRLKMAAQSQPLYVSRAGDQVFGSFSAGAVMLADHPDLDQALMAADRKLYAEKSRLGGGRAA